MQNKLILLACIEIVLSLTVSVLILFISFSVLQKLFFKKVTLKEHNMAFSIFVGGVIVSIGMLISEIIPSITAIIRLSMSGHQEITMGTVIQYSSLYLGIGFLFSILINGAVFVLFSMLTKGINEFKDIQNNNSATAIVVTAILIAITLITKDSISLLISALVPYPEVTNFL